MLMTVVAPHYVCGVRVVLGHCFLIYCILRYTEESWLHYLVFLLSCVCVFCVFLEVPCADLWSVIVAFADDT